MGNPESTRFNWTYRLLVTWPSALIGIAAHLVVVLTFTLVMPNWELRFLLWASGRTHARIQRRNK